MNAKEARKITDEVLHDDIGFKVVLARISAAAKRGETNITVFKDAKRAPFIRNRLVALGYQCSNVKSHEERDGIEYFFSVSW